jgi:hypothetical protein
MSVNDWLEASERLRSAILGRFGTLAEFARRVPMEATQLTATLKPHRRPTVETLDRFSAVLEWPPNRLREWYGFQLAERNGDGAPPPLREDRDYSPAEVAGIVAWVRALPGEAYRRIIAEQERDLAPEDFIEFCLDAHTAWMSNLTLAHKQQHRRWRATNGIRA